MFSFSSAKVMELSCVVGNSSICVAIRVTTCVDTDAQMRMFRPVRPTSALLLRDWQLICEIRCILFHMLFLIAHFVDVVLITGVTFQLDK